MDYRCVKCGSNHGPNNDLIMNIEKIDGTKSKIVKPLKCTSCNEFMSA